MFLLCKQGKKQYAEFSYIFPLFISLPFSGDIHVLMKL